MQTGRQAVDRSNHYKHPDDDRDRVKRGKTITALTEAILRVKAGDRARDRDKENEREVLTETHRDKSNLRVSMIERGH